MVKPTVGRLVWYYGSPGDHLAGAVDGPLAAIVCKVWSDTCVNLAVFDANGVAQSRTSVLLVQPEAERPAHGFCAWMPYQIQKAKEGQGSESAVTG